MHVKKTIINSEKLIFSQVLRQFLNIGFYCGHTYLLILLTDLFNILGSGGHADQPDDIFLCDDGTADCTDK